MHCRVQFREGHLSFHSGSGATTGIESVAAARPSESSTIVLWQSFRVRQERLELLLLETLAMEVLDLFRLR